MILTIVDIFTSLCINIPLKSKEASEVANALWFVFSIMGIPKTIQTDHGGEFENNMIEKLILKMKSNHIMNVPYHHEANGKVENQIKTVSVVLHKLMSEHGTDWKTLLPSATLFINAKVKEMTGVSPFTLMFNRPTRLFDDVFEQKPPNEVPVSLEDEIEAWKLHQKDVLDLIYPAMSNIIQSKQEKAAAAFNKSKRVSSKLLPLKVGTVVYLYDQLRKSNMVL